MCILTFKDILTNGITPYLLPCAIILCVIDTLKSLSKFPVIIHILEATFFKRFPNVFLTGYVLCTALSKRKPNQSLAGDFRSPGQGPGSLDGPVTNSKKKPRRGSSTASAQAAQQSPAINDLVPPPLTGAFFINVSYYSVA